MEQLLTQGRLAEHPFMEGADAEFLNQMDEFAEEKTFEKGEVLFREGDFADRFYLILEGEAAMECDLARHPMVISKAGPGEMLGWCWLYAPFKWQCTARATRRCTALELNGASLLIRAEEDPRFGYELMKRTSRYLLQWAAAMRTMAQKSGAA